MTQPSQSELSPVAASFAAHLRAFHRGLPPEEQALLEEVLALADRGMATDDTGGYAVVVLIGQVLAKALEDQAAQQDRGTLQVPSFSFGSLLR